MERRERLESVVGERATLVLVRLAEHRWAAVVDYGDGSGRGQRSGYWCEDAEGGWGLSRKSAHDAIAQCARPVTHRTLREARGLV